MPSRGSVVRSFLTLISCSLFWSAPAWAGDPGLFTIVDTSGTVLATGLKYSDIPGFGRYYAVAEIDNESLPASERVGSGRRIYFNLIDRTGRVLVSDALSQVQAAAPATGGIAYIQRHDRQDWDLIDVEGKTIQTVSEPPPQPKPTPPHGLVRFKEKDRGGFKDMAGRVVIPAKYYDLGDFSDGLIILDEGSSYGAIDTTGKKVFKGLKDRPTPFRNGRSRIHGDKGTRYIDPRGKVVIPGPFDDGFMFSGGFARVRLPGASGYSYIDTTGKVIFPGPYSESKDFEGGIALAKVGDEAQILGSDGSILHRTTKYDLREVQDGLVRYHEFRIGFGYMDRNGRILLPPRPEFGVYESYSNGLALMRLGGGTAALSRAILDEAIAEDEAAKRKAAEKAAAEAAKNAPKQQAGPPPGMTRHVWFRLSQAAETISRTEQRMGATYTVYIRHYYLDYAYVDAPPGTSENQVAGTVAHLAPNHSMAKGIGDGVFLYSSERVDTAVEAFKHLGLKYFDYDRIDTKFLGTKQLGRD